MLRIMASQVFPLAVTPGALHAMTRDPARVPRGSRPPGTARSWYATAGTALAAAIVLLALHTDSAIIAAGLLALAAAGTALAVARRRFWRAETADVAQVAQVIVTALILAMALSVLLGVIAAARPTR
jgi:lysylphosphatidylglycerol synthetase-like protein (DUF2156 family)